MKKHNLYYEEITPKRQFFDVNLKEIWDYKDLLFLFVKRDFISIYKQTILGPLWFFIQPILTTIIFTIVFGKIAGISTDGIPQILFYLAGITCWNYFSECLNKTSNTFIENQNIFGKVYFPRIIIPISIVASSLIKFKIQFLLFLLVFFYYLFSENTHINPNLYIFLFPILLLTTSLLSLGVGLIITSLTTKYRDFRFLIQFGVQLWMYATPIIYPLSTLDGKLKTMAILNPMTSIIETFKFGFLGQGTFNWYYLLYTFIITFLLLFLGIRIFNKTEQNFMDTV
ncbi:MAG: ABC transporter permease [Crocinitomicaceae bacterium]|nr:ABC transporter permease [Crocinitomicaceae bacterium]